MKRIMDDPIRKYCLCIGICTGLPGVLLLIGCILGKEAETKWWIASIAFVLISFFTLHRALEKRDRVSRAEFNKYRDIKLMNTLKSNAANYYRQIGNVDERNLFKSVAELYSAAVNQYFMEILNQPIQYYKPISTQTAAFWGTQIGGLATGLAAAANAEKRQKEFEKNQIEVQLAKLKLGDAQERAKNSYSALIELVNKYPEIKKDWEETCLRIEKEMLEEYKVRG